MSTVNLALAVTGGLVLVLGLYSNPLSQLPITAPMIAVLVGVVLGPQGLGLIAVARWGNQEIILEQAARLTLAVGLMGVALRLPVDYPRQQWRRLTVLLGLVMPIMWLVAGLLIYLILGLPFWLAMLAGAVVTPTDPVVSSTIVTGRLAEHQLPRWLRQIISAESGANDGLAYPLVLLAILLLVQPTGTALRDWVGRVILLQVGGATLAGAALGYLAGWLLEWSLRRKIIAHTSYLAYTVALSLTVLGVAKLFGSDGILAVFVSGTTYLLARRDRQAIDQENVQEAVNNFFILPIFVLFGLVLPWHQWIALGWTGVLVGGAVLLLKRLPALLLLAPLLGRQTGWAEAAFLGWFGPVAVAALYYANVAVRRTGAPEIWTITSLIIALSIGIHGVTATPLTRLYGQHRQAPPSGQGRAESSSPPTD